LIQMRQLRDGPLFFPPNAARARLDGRAPDGEYEL
jgi:hypothetical protein